MQKFQSEYHELTDCALLISNLSDNCSNQKKSCQALKFATKKEIERVNKDLIGCNKNIAKFKNEEDSFDDRSLRQNSSFFERKRNSASSVAKLQTQFEEIKNNSSLMTEKFKLQKKQWSRLFK